MGDDASRAAFGVGGLGLEAVRLQTLTHHGMVMGWALAKQLCILTELSALLAAAWLFTPAHAPLQPMQRTGSRCHAATLLAMQLGQSLPHEHNAGACRAAMLPCR